VLVSVGEEIMAKKKIARCGKKARKKSGENRYAVKQALRYKKAKKQGRHE